MNFSYPDPNKYFKELNINVDQVRKITKFKPDVAIILGSGLSGFTKNIDVAAKISCKQLLNFPIATVPGHKGTFIFGKIHGVKVVCLDGRIHYYEGYPMHEVAKPIRLMYLLGARTAIITNACGALNPYYRIGDIVAVSDHISSFVPSPLLGPNISQLGKKFVDMSSVYDEELAKEAYIIAQKHNIRMNMGIYLQVRGPQYESPTETRMYHSLGADVIAMSATCEAIAARHMGMRVSQFSMVTNMTGGLQEKVTDNEVKKNADKNRKNFSTVINGVIKVIAKENKSNKKKKSKKSSKKK